MVYVESELMERFDKEYDAYAKSEKNALTELSRLVSRLSRRCLLEQWRRRRRRPI
jgi:hypothetical protein